MTIAKKEKTQKVLKVAPGENVRYVLKLYVTGMTPKSRTAIRNVRAFLTSTLKDSMNWIL